MFVHKDGTYGWLKDGQVWLNSPGIGENVAHMDDWVAMDTATVIHALNKGAKRQKEIDALLEQRRSAQMELTRQRNSLKEYLTEKVNDEALDGETAQEIADIFGIELLERRNVICEVKVTIAVEWPLGEEPDPDDVASELSIDHNEHGIEDWDVQSADWE